MPIACISRSVAITHLIRGRVRLFSTQSVMVAPLSAASLRALDVQGVVALVKLLGVDANDAEKLSAQKIDGFALLETTEDKLRSCGVLLGPASAIMRAIAPAVAEVESAASRATVEALSSTLTIFPPKKKKTDPNNMYKVKLTPNIFLVMFSPLLSPLWLVNSSGSFLRIITSLEEAVEASRKGMFLHSSRRYDDDLTALNGFVTNCATALELKSTLALAGNANLLIEFGPLDLINEGEVVGMKLTRSGEKQLKLAPDGLVISLQSSVVLFNSAKHTPSAAHVEEVLKDVATLEEMFADWENVMTDPPEAKAQLRCQLRVVPFLSGDNFSTVVMAECREKGIGVVRPSGEGFIVEAATK
jgi:hypothetical protein